MGDGCDDGVTFLDLGAITAMRVNGSAGGRCAVMLGGQWLALVADGASVRERRERARKR